MTAGPAPAPACRAPRAVDEERRHRRQRLAATLRIFARHGFDAGAGGHVTARDPRDPDTFWINPFGRHFGLVQARDLLRVDRDGAVVEGDGTVNPAGFAIHSAVHEARPDAVSVAHSHSVHGQAFSTLGVPLAPLTQDACAFFEDHAVFGEFGGVVLDPAEGQRIAATLGTGKAVVLRSHGLLTVGGSVEEAAWWFVAMDRCCQVQLVAAAAGDPEPVPAPVARATAAVMGAPGMGRLNFRPLYDRVVRDEPDLLL